MPGNHKQRLDEILVAQHLISEAAIKEALMRQKAHGGRFGSQLLYHRYINEAALVKALCIQLGCEGVEISRMEIPRQVIEMIPAKVAIARKVIPFEYEAATNCLKVACEDPTDHGLVKELSFVARGKDIKPYVAAEIALNTAIAKYYLGRDTSLDANLLLEIPDDATRAGGAADAAGPAALSQREQDEKLARRVLIATDEEYAASLLQSLLEREGYEVTVADTPAAACDRLAKQQFHTVFISDSLLDGTTDLDGQARSNAPGIVIRRFKSIHHLVLNEPKEIEVELLMRNLELLTSLLASRANPSANHGGLVGQYATRLCRKLNLAERDRLVITDAAYLHDLARFYYGAGDPEDHRKTIQLTVRLLASLNYPRPVTDVLRNMYTDAGSHAPGRPFEVLGGNILTAVDLLCNAIPHDEPFSLDKFDVVKRKLRDLAGKLLSAEIVEGLIEMIQDDILNVGAVKRSVQVFLYCDDPTVEKPLELRLRNEGFVTVPITSIATLVELYERCEPDLVVLVAVGKAAQVVGLVEHLTVSGFRFDLTPVFLVTEGSSVSGLTGMLDRGIEDIVGLDDNLDLLASKIHKLAARMCASARPQAQDAGLSAGAQGRLADISLIDLIQALGPGGRTVRITVAPDAYTSKKLTVCLDAGRIVFAAFDDLAGAEAVYEGLTWTEGAWHVEPVTPEDLPAPNNDLSNEAILMEGCRLIDERVRAGRLL
jgi:DNA-binding response OmpR family regulator